MKTNLITLLILVLGFCSCITKKVVQSDDTINSQVNITTKPAGGNYAIISGHVQDLKTKEPLISAKVMLSNNKSGNFGAMTDQDGNFTIKLVPLNEYELNISYFSYNKVEMPISLKEVKTYSLDVKLGYKPMMVEKPLIYLYPLQTQHIHVQLNYDGKLTHTYPAYPGQGWNVTASPDGTLWDEGGKEYYALFWEGEAREQLIPYDGFVVPGSETAAFLEEKLAYLGLNRREANEFIMYWLPRMENNPYNFIHFAGKAYTDQAQLNITPKPETTIRVMMLTKALDENIEFPLQDITPLKKVRKGYTAVEWGGTVIHHLNTNL
jgi:hypothetical protein